MEIVFVNLSNEVYHTFPMHQHGYWEVLLNLRGKGVATIGEAEYPFREGTIFCIPPGVLHRKESEDGFTDATLFVKDYQPIGGRAVDRFEDDADQTFQSLLRMAYAVHAKHAPNQTAVLNAMGAVFYQLLVGWNDARTDHNRQVEHFENLLLHNVANASFDVSDAMRKVGYCTSHFRKLFKDRTGHPPLHHFQHLRVEHAKRLFQQYPGVHTVKEVAAMSGFSDPYYFSRVFKAQEGISPARYERELGTFEITRIAGADPSQRERLQPDDSVEPEHPTVPNPREWMQPDVSVEPEHPTIPNPRERMQADVAMKADVMTDSGNMPAQADGRRTDE